MKSSFKLFLEKGTKTVLFRGKFNDYNDFEMLRQKIITTSQSPSFKNSKKAIKEEDKILLSFGEGSPFVPSNLTEGIWDNKTYEYFLEKLRNRKLFNVQYKLYVEKKKELPVFKEIKYTEVLAKALEDIGNPMMNQLKAELPLVKLEKSKINFDKKQEQLTTNYKNFSEEEHENIICNNCFEKGFHGPRFVCCECNNYNLCMNCEKLLKKEQFHDREHVFVQVNKAIGEDEKCKFCDYNNFFGNKEQTNRIVENSFDVKFSIINAGDNDLLNCYIIPVRYGEKYLSCKPLVINEKIARNERKDVEIRIRRGENFFKGVFEGYFRMFTPSGIPFGNILHITNILGD